MIIYSLEKHVNIETNKEYSKNQVPKLLTIFFTCSSAPRVVLPALFLKTCCQAFFLFFVHSNVVSKTQCSASFGDLCSGIHALTYKVLRHVYLLTQFSKLIKMFIKKKKEGLAFISAFCQIYRYNSSP